MLDLNSSLSTCSARCCSAYLHLSTCSVCWPRLCAPAKIGDLAVADTIHPCPLQYGPPNATTASLAVNAVPAGSMVYVYIGLGSDMAFVDALAAKVSGRPMLSIL